MLNDYVLLMYFYLLVCACINVMLCYRCSLLHRISHTNADINDCFSTAVRWSAFALFSLTFLSRLYSATSCFNRLPKSQFWDQGTYNQFYPETFLARNWENFLDNKLWVFKVFVLSVTSVRKRNSQIRSLTLAAYGGCTFFPLFVSPSVCLQ